MSVQVSYKKQILISMMFLFVIIAIVEVSARVIEYALYPCNLLKSDTYKNFDYFSIKQICFDQQNLLYYEQPFLHLRPDQHSKTVNINSLGFRGPEFTREKPETIFRIFLVGGSTTFGASATSDDSTITSFLQKKFDDVKLTKKIQVVNAGISSATSFEETYYIKDILVQLNPDLIVIYDGFNDASYRVLSDPVISEDAKVKELEGFKFKKIPFYRTPWVIHDIFFTKIPHADSSKSVDADSTKKVISLWKSRVEEICNLGKENGFATLIAVQPILIIGAKNLTDYESKYAAKTDSDFATKITLEGITDSLRDLNSSCVTVDLSGAFDGITEPIYTDIVHVNDNGNRIIAEKLYDVTLPVILENLQN